MNVNGIGLIGRLFNFLAKIYWAIFILCLIVIFAPTDFARSTGIKTLREQNEIPLWILLIFLGAWLVRDIIFFIGKSATKRASNQ
jgi:hypothetical protein